MKCNLLSFFFYKTPRHFVKCLILHFAKNIQTTYSSTFYTTNFPSATAYTKKIIITLKKRTTVILCTTAMRPLFQLLQIRFSRFIQHPRHNLLTPLILFLLLILVVLAVIRIQRRFRIAAGRWSRLM